MTFCEDGIWDRLDSPLFFKQRSCWDLTRELLGYGSCGFWTMSVLFHVIFVLKLNNPTLCHNLCILCRGGGSSSSFPYKAQGAWCTSISSLKGTLQPKTHITLENRLPGPHATARNCLMTKCKVHVRMAQQQGPIYHTATFPSAPTITPLFEDFTTTTEHGLPGAAQGCNCGGVDSPALCQVKPDLGEDQASHQ